MNVRTLKARITSSDKKLETLKNHYTIKSDGAVKLNVSTAVKSERFRNTLSKIKKHELLAE